MKKRRIRRFVLSVLLTFVIMAACVAGILFWAVHSLYKSSSYETETFTVTETEKQTGTEQTESESGEEKAAILSDENVYNVLLLGVDTRTQTGEADSGLCLLLSVNDTKKQRSLVTIPRDLLVEVPGQGEQRIDRVYALGGGSLAAKTVTENFRVQVERYLAVDFDSLPDIVDTAGGIPLTVSEEEASAANAKVRELCSARGVSADGHLFGGGGTFVCDGIQALAYARIDDGAASEDLQAQRQRQILTSLINVLGKSSLLNMYTTAQGIFSALAHNIPESEMWTLLTKLGTITGYTESQIDAPMDTMAETVNVDGGTALAADWTVTAAYVQGTLY